MKNFYFTFLMFAALTLNAQTFDWTQQTSGTTSTLRDVFFIDNQKGWVVGSDGVILNTSDGGQNWTAQTSGTSEILRAVFFLNDTLGWAAGGSLDKTLLKTTNGGSTWQDAASDDSYIYSIYDVAFVDEMNGWLVTFDSVFTSTDGGSSWVSEGYVNSIEVPRPRAIAIASDTLAYIAGSRQQSGNLKADIFWRRQDFDPYLWWESGFNNTLSDDRFTSIDMNSSTSGYAGSENGKLFKLNYDPDFPSTWELNYQLTGTSGINSVSFSNLNDGMFNTSIDISSTTYALIYHTTDSGENWSSPDSIPNLLSAVLHSPDSVNAWIVGAEGKIFKGTSSIVGIQNMDLNLNLSVYPNPTKGIINVSTQPRGEEWIQISVIDMSGKILFENVYKLNPSNNKFSIDLSEFKSGVYYLWLKNDRGQTAQKIVKK